MRRRAEPELEPMPATLAALPSHGRWMDAGWGLGVPLLPLVVVGHKRAKARSNQAWAAPAGPVRPITDQRPEPTRAPRRSKSGSRWRPLGRWRLLTCVHGGPSDAGRTAASPGEARVRPKRN